VNRRRVALSTATKAVRAQLTFTRQDEKMIYPFQSCLLKLKQFEITTDKSEVSGSHGGEYEDDCVLGCCVCSLLQIYRSFRGASCCPMNKEIRNKNAIKRPSLRHISYHRVDFYHRIQ
jgi:hypothetical protein